MKAAVLFRKIFTGSSYSSASLKCQINGGGGSPNIQRVGKCSEI